jgi:phasin family protein
MKESIEKFFTPISDLSNLTISNIEKFTELQQKSFEENSKVSLNAIKSATEINDIEGLKSYMSKQLEVAETVANNAKENANKVAELSKYYSEEARKIVEQSMHL